MSNYYFLSGKNRPQVASAFAPDKTKLSREWANDLEGLTEFPVDFQLIKLTVEKNGLKESDNLNDLNEIWLDYIPNSLAWPFMSLKLKSIIERHLTGNENINWISAKVSGNNEERTYYIPRFEKMLDVLDIEKTMFVNGTDLIIKPFFSLSKIRNFAIFHKPSSHNLWKITSGLYINELLKKAIQKENISGIQFEKVRVG